MSAVTHRMTQAALPVTWYSHRRSDYTLSQGMRRNDGHKQNPMRLVLTSALECQTGLIVPSASYEYSVGRQETTQHHLAQLQLSAAFCCVLPSCLPCHEWPSPCPSRPLPWLSGLYLFVAQPSGKLHVASHHEWLAACQPHSYPSDAPAVNHFLS